MQKQLLLTSVLQNSCLSCSRFQMFFKIGVKCIKFPPLMFSWECSDFLKQQKQPPEVSCKKSVLKNFVIFTGKYLCWSFFLVKLTPKTSKRLQHRCFLVNIAKVLRTFLLQNTSGGCFCCFKKFKHSQENISGGGLIHLSF